MSTIDSFVGQYCISHKTVSHRAAAATGPEVPRKRLSDDLMYSFTTNKSRLRHCGFVAADHNFKFPVHYFDLRLNSFIVVHPAFRFNSF